MRNVGALVTVAVMLFAGLVALVLWGPFGEKPGLREAQELGVPPAAEPAPGVPATEKPRVVRSTGPGMRGEEPSAEGVSPSAVAAPAAAEVAPPKPERRFPLGNEIALGTDKTLVQTTFGKPTMRTTAVDGGRLLETWVYLKSDPNIATFILVRNGRVVSANTTVY